MDERDQSERDQSERDQSEQDMERLKKAVLDCMEATGMSAEEIIKEIFGDETAEDEQPTDEQR